MEESSSRHAMRPVLIAGGGFGGLYTALALASRRHHPPILLVEPQERFLFLPLLYELLSQELRSWEVAPRYDTLLASRGIAWLKDRVSRIDASAGCVHTEQGRQLPYSRLVIATGSRGTSYGIPGVEDLAIPFRSLADVERLQELVQHLRSHPRPLQRLALVGAGPSGVELACKLADLLRGSTVIELIEQGPDLLPQARAFNREQARSALLRRDVRLRTQTRVLGLEPGRLLLSLTADNAAGSDESLPVDGVIWTAGVTVAPLRSSPSPASTPGAACTVNRPCSCATTPVCSRWVMWLTSQMPMERPWRPRPRWPFSRPTAWRRTCCARLRASHCSPSAGRIWAR
ncbi:FAD-dependent oxidoreductase [Cyanobium sp. BSA11S]|uniref:NAD(P)/FAD-dependent oxidoreductase n=1 Tax=Cyanobium sp. BSA11S TaxID=3108224 RepID=UPI003D8127C0